jgi:hypothetical protein
MLISLYLVTAARYSLPPFPGLIDQYDPHTEEHNWRSVSDPDDALRRRLDMVRALPKDIPPTGAILRGDDVIDKRVTKFPDWYKLSKAELPPQFILPKYRVSSFELEQVTIRRGDFIGIGDDRTGFNWYAVIRTTVSYADGDQRKFEFWLLAQRSEPWGTNLRHWVVLEIRRIP